MDSDYNNGNVNQRKITRKAWTDLEWMIEQTELELRNYLNEWKFEEYHEKVKRYRWLTVIMNTIAPKVRLRMLSQALTRKKIAEKKLDLLRSSVDTKKHDSLMLEHQWFSDKVLALKQPLEQGLWVTLTEEPWNGRMEDIQLHVPEEKDPEKIGENSG